MAPSAVPPGWPAGLPGPGDPALGDRVEGWLLDRLPPVVREYPQLRRHRLALALMAHHHWRAVLAGQRATYAAWRRELAGDLAPEEIADTLLVVEATGHDAAATVREVDLVLEALRGRTWRERL